MNTQSMFKLNAHKGVELWRLLTDGVEQFAVRFGRRRARFFASRTAAEALFAHHVRQDAILRSH